MKQNTDIFNIYNIYLANTKKENDLYYFCVKNEEGTHVHFIRDLENPVKIEDVEFGKPQKISKDAFFITIMEKYGSRISSLEQLLLIERIYIGIQKDRITIKKFEMEK